jgi:hypothetical protein
VIKDNYTMGPFMIFQNIQYTNTVYDYQDLSILTFKISYIVNIVMTQ